MPTPPPAARPAATVVLLRDAPGPPPAAPQVFLQRRVAGMAFAGGMTVFPGGGVDAGDRPDARAVARAGPGDWWARHFGCPPDVAGALVAAAVRETFEECGVLLAGPGPRLRRGRPRRPRRPPPDAAPTSSPRPGSPLRADLLAPWSRWVTPEAEPRRYDTAFFVARVPAAQEADARTTEAVEAAGGTRPTRWRARSAATCGCSRRRSTRWRRSPRTPTRAAVLDAARSRPVRTYRPLLERGTTAPSWSSRARPSCGSTSGRSTSSGAHPAYGSCGPSRRWPRWLLQDNPSPMTLEGTNTWVLRAPDARECVVVDPGDDDDGHLRAVAAHGPVALVLLTHRHHDHAARRAPLRGADGRAGAGARPVAGRWGPRRSATATSWPRRAASCGWSRRRGTRRTRCRSCSTAGTAGPPCSPATPSSAGAPP